MVPRSWCDRHSAPSCHYQGIGQAWAYPSCGARRVPVNRARLIQAEELVRSRYERKGACSAMANVTLALHQLAQPTQLDTGSAQQHPRIHRRQHHTESLQRCELAQVGFREIRATPTVLPFITQHHRYSQLHAHMAARAALSRIAFDNYTTDLTISEETHFALLDGTFLALVFLWRAAGERRGPGLCGDASTPSALLSVCVDLLRSFGPSTCLLYNEGIHHNNTTSTRSAFQSSVSHMCSLLHTLSLQTGAVALVRETAAQNFPTPTAPPGHEGEFPFASSGQACISPSPVRMNWHNVVLWAEATRWNLSMVPFYKSTISWGSVLFEKTRDCTHERCYTPAYYGPLWSDLRKSLLESMEHGRVEAGAGPEGGREGGLDLAENE